MKRHVRKTGDGSTTIYIPEMDENYHSHHGAIQEARHVFIEHGLKFLNKKELTIFEMGLGTGLNALLTLDFSLLHKTKIHYIGLEAYPVDLDMIDELNYVGSINPELHSSFVAIHQQEWGSSEAHFEEFTLEKVHEKIESYQPSENSVDLIYFDAFGPRAQSDMWELPVLEKMAKMLKPGGVLVTYCAQGQFKRHLKSLGFEIERLPGPPGKREMTRATLVSIIG